MSENGEANGMEMGMDDEKWLVFSSICQNFAWHDNKARVRNIYGRMEIQQVLTGKYEEFFICPKIHYLIDNAFRTAGAFVNKTALKLQWNSYLSLQVMWISALYGA